jgi:hypothetical protein
MSRYYELADAIAKLPVDELAQCPVWIVWEIGDEVGIALELRHGKFRDAAFLAWLAGSSERAAERRRASARKGAKTRAKRAHAIAQEQTPLPATAVMP